MIRETNRRLDAGDLSPSEAKGLVTWLSGVQSVLALEPDDEAIPEAVAALVERRAAARTAKDWKASDSIRNEIAALGWSLKDTKDGQKLTRDALATTT